MKKYVNIFISLFLFVFLHSANIDSLFNEIENVYKDIDDYSCYLHEYIVKGKKTTDNIWSYKYLKPGYIYMESIEGNRKGSVAFYDCKTQKVTGRRGGALRFIKLTLPLTNSLVQNIRGITIAESDWFYVINRTRNILKEMNVQFELNNGIFENREVDILHIRNIPFEKYKFDESVMYFHNGKLLGFNNYEKGELVERIKYTNIKLNNGYKKQNLIVK